MSESMKTAFWLIGIFFTLMVIGLGYTLKLALDNAEPILDETYYEKGHIDAREKAEALGFRIQGEVFDATSLQRGEQSIAWTLVIPDGQTVKVGDVDFKLTLDQPATSRYRQVLDIQQDEIQQVDGNLVFQKKVNLKRPGYWDVIIEGKKGELYFHRAQRLAVQ